MVLHKTCLGLKLREIFNCSERETQVDHFLNQVELGREDRTGIGSLKSYITEIKELALRCHLVVLLYLVTL